MLNWFLFILVGLQLPALSLPVATESGARIAERPLILFIDF